MNIYCLRSGCGFLKINDDGWLRNASSIYESTHFVDGWYDGKMYIQVKSGKWNERYIGADWDTGVGAYEWKDCAYVKWDGDRMQSQTGRTSGHHLVYRKSNGVFYFYDDGGSDYVDVLCTKESPYYVIFFKNCYAQFDAAGWLTTTPRIDDATVFRDREISGNMCVLIESGAWKGKFVGGNWDQGVGAYGWDDCGYMRWDAGRLQSLQSNETSGHHLVYRRSNGRFYFYDSGSSDEYESGATKYDLDIKHSLLNVEAGTTQPSISLVQNLAQVSISDVQSSSTADNCGQLCTAGSSDAASEQLCCTINDTMKHPDTQVEPAEECP